MKILLRRHIKTGSAGMLGGTKTTYALDVRAELTPEETATVELYKPLWDAVLYQRLPGTKHSLLPIPDVMLPDATDITIRLKEAVKGLTVETKDPTQPIAMIAQIKEKAGYLKELLTASGDLTGEEVVEI
jgi:hypothetical protein